MADQRPNKDNGWLTRYLERLSAQMERNAEKILKLCSDIAVLEDLRGDVADLITEVRRLREDIAIIKTKLSTYGAISGALAGVGMAIITALLMRAFGL